MGKKNLEKESNCCFLLLCALSKKLHLYISKSISTVMLRFCYKYSSGIHKVNEMFKQNFSSLTEVESQKLFFSAM